MQHVICGYLHTKSTTSFTLYILRSRLSNFKAFAYLRYMLQFYFEEAAYHESPNKLPAVWAFFISNKMVSYHILDQSTQHFTVMIA